MAVNRTRAPFILLALLCLLLALWAGLVRIGWNLPPLLQTLPAAHGPLMAAGFVGTLIALERAAALGRGWSYLAPLLTGLGSLTLIVSPGLPGEILITLGSAVLVLVFIVIVRRQPALFTATMLLGTVAWLIGNVLWSSGFSIFQVVLWWAGYLILTIAGERLELGRIRALTRPTQALFALCVGLFLLGQAVGLGDLGTGVRVSGVALIGLALWLLRYDVAGVTVRRSGLTRFIAVSLLAGFVWLAVGGLLAVALDRPFGRVTEYDALLHSLLLGFVMSMIMAHAPIILPAILGRPLAYSSAFYAHLALLHASLLIRVWGDLADAPMAREWGGMLNVLAILLFLANTARALVWLPAARPGPAL